MRSSQLLKSARLEKQPPASITGWSSLARPCYRRTELGSPPVLSKRRVPRLRPREAGGGNEGAKSRTSFYEEDVSPGSTPYLASDAAEVHVGGEKRNDLSASVA